MSPNGSCEHHLGILRDAKLDLRAEMGYFLRKQTGIDLPSMGSEALSLTSMSKSPLVIGLLAVQGAFH